MLPPNPLKFLMFDSLVRQWADSWSVPLLAETIKVESSPRLRRSLGRCNPQTGAIRLHPALLAEPEGLLKEVLCHEAAHVAVYLLHGDSVRAHGSEWARLMKVAGFEPRARKRLDQLSRGFQRVIRPRVLYRHGCPVCGAQRLARRAVRRWRCRACLESGLEGRLEISTQPYVPVGDP